MNIVVIIITTTLFVVIFDIAIIVATRGDVVGGVGSDGKDGGGGVGGIGRHHCHGLDYDYDNKMLYIYDNDSYGDKNSYNSWNKNNNYSKNFNNNSNNDNNNGAGTSAITMTTTMTTIILIMVNIVVIHQYIDVTWLLLVIYDRTGMLTNINNSSDTRCANCCGQIAD